MKQPRLVVSAWSTPDGRVALNRTRVLLNPDANRIWRSLDPSSAKDVDDARRAALDRLYHPEAVLEGSGTFVTDDVGPLDALPAVEDPSVDIYADFLPDEIVNPPGLTRKWFTVVDSRGRVRWSERGGGEFHLLVLVSHATPARYLAYLRRENLPYLVAGEAQVDLGAARCRMRERLGVTCVVSKAGGGLNGALLRAGLVDEVNIVMLPALIGGFGTPTVFDGPPLGDDEFPTPLKLLSVHAEIDGTVWLRYEVRRDS